MTLRLDSGFEYKFVSALHNTYPEFGAVTQPMAGSDVRPRCLSCDLVTRTLSPGTKLVIVCTLCTGVPCTERPAGADLPAPGLAPRDLAAPGPGGVSLGSAPGSNKKL